MGSHGDRNAISRGGLVNRRSCGTDGAGNALRNDGGGVPIRFHAASLWHNDGGSWRVSFRNQQDRDIGFDSAGAAKIECVCLALASGPVEVVCFQQGAAADADLTSDMAVMPIGGQHISAAGFTREIDGDVMGAAKPNDESSLENGSPMAATPGVRDEIEVELDAGIDKCHEIADRSFNGGEVGHVFCYWVDDRSYWLVDSVRGADAERSASGKQAIRSAVRVLGYPALKSTIRSFILDLASAITIAMWSLGMS